MKIGYFDCFSGISGDMVLGALVDAGCELGRIEAELRKLPVSGWGIFAEKVTRGALSATRVKVECSEHHHHRSLNTILGLISQAGLSRRVATRASEIFRRLGESEARIHNVPVEQIHFHEVGAVDAIVDIVGACVGFELMGIEDFACSSLNVGGGRVQTAHGILPVPAPAAADLLRGAPTYSTGIERELVTPTGAAIASTLVSEFGAQPSMTVSAIGYGAGAAELDEQPNVLRMFVGQTVPHEAGHDDVTVIEANLDDMNPQIYGYFAECALAAGALDVFSAPVQMKKNRPGQLLTVLCRPKDVDLMIDLIFKETTTIGVRTYHAGRRTLDRESVAVNTPLGTVRMKIARTNGHVLNVAPEYEDCQRIATERRVPLKQVIAEAEFCFQQQSASERKKDS
jgi:uncharacterized protein (TIGR00299 family) protein